MPPTTPAGRASRCQDLGSRLVKGDVTVLQPVLEELGPRAVRRLRRRYPSLTEADWEDVLVETLFRLWQRRASFDPGRRLAAWFLTIADNVVKDLLKAAWQRARRRERPADWDRLRPPARRPADGPPAALSRAETDLLEIVRGLPEVDREILLASTSGAADWAAALAEGLGVPAGTLRVRRLRLLRKVRAAMARLGHPLPGAGRTEAGDRS
jgi:RNA polymerase sigma-70 factor (ECF subfamily)